MAFSCKTYSSPFHVVCSGYNQEDYERIRDYLSISGSYIITRIDDTEGINIQGSQDADVILTGRLGSSEEISDQIRYIRKKFPKTAIIRCISEGASDPSRDSLMHLYDGHFYLDFSSQSWGENLVSTICQALRLHHRNPFSQITNTDVYFPIFEKNSVPMILSIPDSGTVIEVNRAFLKTFEYERTEVLGKTSLKLNLFVTKAERDSVVKEYRVNHPYQDIEFLIRTRDNKSITYLVSAYTVVCDRDEFYLTTLKDISSLKASEKVLKDQNRFIQDILSSISEGIVVYDTSLKYQVWNRYMETLSGIPASEIIGNSIYFLSPRIKGDDVHDLMAKALQGITSTSADISYCVPGTKKTGWVSTIYTPYRDSSGKIIGVIVSIRDISERKKAENAIVTHKLLLRSIIDTVPVWIACIDMDGKIIVTNTAFSSFFGFSPDKIEGCLFEDLLFSPRFEHHISLIKKAFAGREVPFNETIHDPESDIPTMYLRGRYSPLKDVDGEINGVVCVVIDITDLLTAQKTIASINTKLNLLSSITRHDILNSLTAVLGFLTIAEEETDPNLLKTYIRKSNQTARIIQEQIEFTRDYQDLGVHDPTWQYAKDVFSIATKSLKFGDILVETSLNELQIYADPLLERVIYNLVDNALRYGDTIRQISSFWYEDHNHAVWVISDDGVGIAEDMKEKIFAKGVGHNTGLGLFLARDILDITGISISETGKEGEGARFEIVIPHGFWKRVPGI